MTRPSQFVLNLHSRLIVDNFAGGGGASTGIFLALNRHVDIAVNHAADALGMHRINHPQTLHLETDIFDIDPRTACEGKKVGIVWNSPDCKHFSKAKGGKPLSKKIRGLILVMLRWAKYGAECMFMENVEEIKTWGPLIEREKKGVKGWYPDPAHAGRTWRAFLACLSTGIAPNHPDLAEILEVLGGTVTRKELIRGFGFKYEVEEIRAFHKGAPTVRKRLYMIARCDGRPIVWPEDTHENPAKIKPGTNRKPWRTVAECIDFTRHCPSIFLTKEEAKEFRCKRPLVVPTLRRVAKGVDRYVMKAARPFLVSLTHQGGDRIEEVDGPAMTITGANRGEKALVQPSMVAGAIVGSGGPAFSAKPTALDKPGKSQTTENHSALVSATLVHTAHGEKDANGKKRGRGEHDIAGEPLPAITASGDCAVAQVTLAPCMVQGGHTSSNSAMVKGANEPMRTQAGEASHSVIQATLAPLITEFANASQQRNMPADEPGRTLCAEVKGGHFAMVAASMVQTGYGERKGQEPRALDIEKPNGTAVAGGGKHAVLQATLVSNFHGDHQGRSDGDNRNHTPEEPLPVQDTSNRYAVIQTTLAHGLVVNTANGESDGAPSRVVDPNGPLPVVTGVDKFAAVATTMVKLRGDNVGNPVTNPMDTASAGGNHHGLVAVSLTKYNTGSTGSPVTAPAPTILAGSHADDTHGSACSTHGVVACSVVRHFGQSVGQTVDAPAPCTTAGGGGHSGLVATHLAAYFKSERDGQAMDTPARTPTTKPRLAEVESELSPPPLTMEQHNGALRVAAFLREYGVEFEGPYAMCGHYVIVDIGLRMLTPRELFKAQGFPDDYVIDEAWLIDKHTGQLTVKRLTKEQQIRMCGNSVSPPVAEALIRANCPYMIVPPDGPKKARTAPKPRAKTVKSEPAAMLF